MCQSPLEDDELQGLASTDTEAMSTPEPGLESEIEIAAEADKNDDNNGTDQAAGTELLSSAAARLKLSTRPGKDMSLARYALMYTWSEAFLLRGLIRPEAGPMNYRPVICIMSWWVFKAPDWALV